MSEHQIIAFRAIDAPVSEANLAFMRQQSSRAEITPWSFDNEYHYGDFRGDALEMLRRGYDLHVHYANFGIRKLRIRFPNGLPNPEAAEPYFDADGLQLIKDKKGNGQILSISPSHEPGALDQVWNLDEIIDRLAGLRGEILDGDLRPLYLAHLAMARDDNHDPEETKEAPVPAGLEKLTNAQRALAKLYELDDSLIAAAAQGGPTAATREAASNDHAKWLRSQPSAVKDAWLAQLMGESSSAVRGELLTKFQQDRNVPAWPTSNPSRTMAELEVVAEEIQVRMNLRAAEKVARDKAKRLAAAAADPAKVCEEVGDLVGRRSQEAYIEIAKRLAELREALANTDRANLAEQYADQLKNKYPTLRRLNSELRKRKFLAKPAKSKTTVRASRK